MILKFFVRICALCMREDFTLCTGEWSHANYARKTIRVSVSLRSVLFLFAPEYVYAYEYIEKKKKTIGKERIVRELSFCFFLLRVLYH